MSEMLANQYFLVRRFADAEIAFEGVLQNDPGNKQVRKKLIICYVYNGKIRKALDLFVSLIREDITCITSTDVIADDCPCPELIEKFENSNSNYSYINMLEVYGILWLYCDMQKSITYFEKLKEYNSSDKIYKEILNIYSNFTLQRING